MRLATSTTETFTDLTTDLVMANNNNNRSIPEVSLSSIYILSIRVQEWSLILVGKVNLLSHVFKVNDFLIRTTFWETTFVEYLYIYNHVK